MVLLLNLESFDDEQSGKGAPNVRPATYEDGYAEGHKAALVEQSELQVQLKESLVQSLNDSVFGYQEAQAHFISGMTRYLETVLNTLLPATLNSALHSKLKAILMEGVERDAQRPVMLRVSADQVEPVSHIISDLGMTHVSLSAHDDLSEHAAFVVSDDVELSLDFDAALSAIREHSEILLQTSKEVS